jgi:hypothetical protein
MQNAAGSDASVQSEAQDHGYGAVVSDLLGLIEHVQASMRLIEAALTREAPLGNQEVAVNVIVLDDVTPRYARAKAALSASSAGLGVAVHYLLESTPSKHGADESAESDSWPVRLVDRAWMRSGADHRILI